MSRRLKPIELARSLGVHKSSVSRAIAAGRLTLGEDGRLDELQALQQWANTRHGGRPDVAERLALARAAARPAAVAAAAADQEDGLPAADDAAAALEAEPGSLQAYRIDRMTADNARLLLALDLSTHRRYVASRALSEAHGLGATLRAQCERLVDQVAAQLAARSDPAARRNILQAEVRRLSRTVRGSFPAALRRLRDAGEGKGQA
jgi:hypothetical protein